MKKSTSITLIAITLIICATITSTVYMLSKKDSSAQKNDIEKSNSISYTDANQQVNATIKDKIADRPKLDIQYVSADNVDQFDAVCEFKSTATCDLYVKEGKQSKLLYQLKDGVIEQTDEPGRSLVRWKVTRSAVLGSSEVFARTPDLIPTESDSSVSAVPITN